MAEMQESLISQMNEEELRGLIATYQHKVENFEESLAQAALHVDNMGWDPLGGASRSETGLDLEHIKEVSSVAQALVTVNPLAKRGIGVRTSYVWGSGVHLNYARDNRTVHRTIGTTEAQFELERTIACDGNLFLEVEGHRSVRRIPVSQIAGAAEHPEEPGVLTHIRRKYKKYRTDSMSTSSGLAGRQDYTEVDEWIPTVENDLNVSYIPVGGKRVPVNKTKQIKHVAINRLVGWWWGVPDLYAILPWSKAYKEYLEDCNTLNKAYAQFAWEYRASTGDGVERAASQMASAPAIDPMTGQSSNVGGAVITGGDNRLAALQTIRPVDFTNGRPMAALIAAGLEIPLQVLTSDAGQGGSRTVDQTLDEATVNAMIARQKMMDDALADVAYMIGRDSFDIEWPEVSPEPAHRQMQALDQAVRMGALYGEEMRISAGKIVGVDTSRRKEPPSKDELPVVVSMERTAQPEPPSYGDHDLRDQGDQPHVDEV